MASAEQLKALLKSHVTGDDERFFSVAMHNEAVDRAHANMLWTHPGMETYYRNSRGCIVVNSPYLNSTYFELTRGAKPEDYVIEPRVGA